MKTVVLCGGGGGAKLAHGFALALADPTSLTVLVNTGDDFIHAGLCISPDLDTVFYTLAGLLDREKGWGRDGESWTVLEEVRRFGGPAWFGLGDRDIALHIARTAALAAGQTLTEFTETLCRNEGVVPAVLPMTDQKASTLLRTLDGELLEFQEYFVALKWQPVIRAIEYRPLAIPQAARGVLEALHEAELVLIGPSNPFISIDPILRVEGVREAMDGKLVCAVSPLVGGTALKGPAAKLFGEFGLPASSLSVARHYEGLVTHFVIDEVDQDEAAGITQLGVQVLAVDTLMRTVEDRVRLVNDILKFIQVAG